MSRAPRRRRRRSGDHEHVSRISTLTTLFFLAAAVVLLHTVQWILLPFVIAGLIAYVCTPLIEWLAVRSGAPRALFAVAIFLILLGIGTLFGLLGIPPLVDEVRRVAADFSGTVGELARAIVGNRTITVFDKSMNATELAQAIVAALRNWIVQQPGPLVRFGGVAFVSMLAFTLTLILLVYFLLNGPAIVRGLLWLVPPAQRPLIRHIWSRLDPVLRRYFIGVIVVVIYAMVAAYIGLGLVLGIHHAVFLALLTGILEMIPMIGPLAAAAIAGLVAVRYATGIGPIVSYALYAAALRLSIDQMLGPLVLGAAARVHPALIILCFLAGGLLFGITGVILAVPTALIVKTTLAVLYDESDDLDAATPHLD